MRLDKRRRRQAACGCAHLAQQLCCALQRVAAASLQVEHLQLVQQNQGLGMLRGGLLARVDNGQEVVGQAGALSHAHSAGRDIIWQRGPGLELLLCHSQHSPAGQLPAAGGEHASQAGLLQRCSRGAGCRLCWLGGRSPAAPPASLAGSSGSRRNGGVSPQSLGFVLHKRQHQAPAGGGLLLPKVQHQRGCAGERAKAAGAVAGAALGIRQSQAALAHILGPGRKVLQGRASGGM